MPLRTVPVEEIHPPFPADIEIIRMDMKSPAVLRGYARDWPALAKWNGEYFRNEFSDTRVPIASYVGGRVNFLEGVGVDYSELPLGDMLQATRQESRSFAIGAPLERFPARLREDLRRPAVCEDAAWVRSKVFISPGGIGAPLHRDIPHNIYVQIAGRKKWILFSPADNANVYPYPLFSKLPAFARADAETPDFGRFPCLRDARPWECVLEPGDALLLPSFFWHQTRALDFSISVNFWFARGKLALAAWLSDLGKRILGLSR
ncbi:MAG: cupin-like domain-containing protein [Bdellovibrionota bacterium]